MLTPHSPDTVAPRVRRRTHRRLLAALLAAVAASSPAAETPVEVRSLSFEGNETLTAAELGARIVTQETPGMINKFLYKSISEGLGRKDEFYDPLTLGEDLARLRTFYQDNGFFGVLVDSALAFDTASAAVDITIRIVEGYRARIDSMSYVGLVNVPEFVIPDIEAGSKIRAGDPYNQALLSAEVDNVLTVLRNGGYPNALYLTDSSQAVRRLSTGDVTVTLTFDIGRRFRFGAIGIQREGEAVQDDIDDEDVVKHLDYKESDVFNQSDLVSSERNLNRLGLFDLARISAIVPPNSDSAGFVPSRVTIRPADKHELAPELILSDENGNFNIGTGLGYKNRYFFGGVRIFSTRFRFRTATPALFPDYFTLSTDAISNAELTFELLQPYFFSNKIKGSWSFSFILDKQRPYLQYIIRNKIGIVDRFAEYTYGYIDWTLERVDIKRQSSTSTAPEDPGTDTSTPEAPERQFNSIASFTLQKNKTNDPFTPTGGVIHSVTFDESGILPLLLERSQPDIPYTQFFRFILYGRWYHDPSQERYSVLALKLKGGIQRKYGASRSDPTRTIPQTHRFYAGGSNSVRGWASRTLVATGDPAQELGGDLLLDGSIEVRINVFQRLRDGFLDKFWTVLFLDAGNVWERAADLQVRGVALAAGLGLRYDTFFGPFRIDFGLRIYNPIAAPGENPWIFGRRFVGETLADGVIHFGIGNAF